MASSRLLPSVCACARLLPSLAAKMVRVEVDKGGRRGKSVGVYLSRASKQVVARLHVYDGRLMPGGVGYFAIGIPGVGH